MTKNNQIASIGVAIPVVLLSAIILTAIPFTGQQGETYSIFNHFISELGGRRYSELHHLYNSGLIITSLGFLFFAKGLSFFSSTRLSKWAVYIGIFSAILCVFVGLIPEDIRRPHLLIALAFFSCMALSTLLYSIDIIIHQKNRFPLSAGIHGLSISALFVCFISMPKDKMIEKFEKGPLFDRPEIWYLPFFEWLVFFAFISWIVHLSIHMRKLPIQD